MCPPINVPRFLRLFVSIAANIEIAFACGMRFAAVDAAFSKHTEYRDGCLHLLTTRDGNNNVLVLAWAICETESGDTYTFFAQWCYAAGLHRYLNKSCVTFSDRQKGIHNFHDWFESFWAKCFKHIIENARKHIKGTGTNFEDEMAWCLRKAYTRPSYDYWLEKLREVCPAAAHYFDEKVGEHKHVYQYALIDERIATHGHKTSNIVECSNAVFVEARYEAPYRLNDAILQWCGEKLNERVDNIKKWMSVHKHVLTPYCQDLFQQQVLQMCQNVSKCAKMCQMCQLFPG